MMLLARLLSVVVLLLCVSLSLSQPEMPEMPSGPPGGGSDEFSILSFASASELDDFELMGTGQLGFGIPYGGGGKAAFPVGAYGANVGLPAVPAVPLAIAGGGKGKGGGHGHKGGGGARLGFLIAAPIPVAQPYGVPVQIPVSKKNAGAVGYGRGFGANGFGY